MQLPVPSPTFQSHNTSEFMVKKNPAGNTGIFSGASASSP